jgi:uncharacterized phage protein (TIGR01671 family)
MREIKFRTWDTSKKELSYTFSMSDLAREEVHFTVSSWWENLIFQQYTGLKDKNDVEIYEGDILSEGNSGYGYKKLTIVEWREAYSGEQFCEVGLNSELVDYYGGVNPEYKEVVGNIYENQEMVK